MRRQIAAALCSVGLCLAGLGFVTPSLIANAQQDGAATGSQLYSSIKDLMEAIIDPSADALWDAVKIVVDQDGVHEIVPRTPEEWLEVRRAAVRIIEGANLLMMPGREAAPPGARSEVPGVELEPAEMTALIRKDRKQFDAFAEALRSVGLEALKAADGKNAGALMNVGGKLQDVCEGCHKAFWYPNEKPP